MAKSRRVVRKSRKTRGHRGGFFGKLFEGFQTVQTPMVVDPEMGRSAAGSVGTSVVSNVPGMLKALSVDPEMERPTVRSTDTSYVSSMMRPTIASRVVEEDVRAPTAAIAPPPPRAETEIPMIRMDRMTTPVQPRAAVPYVASPRRIDQQIPVRPTSQVRPPPPMNRPATGTAAYLQSLRSGGKRKVRKSHKKSRKTYRRKH